MYADVNMHKQKLIVHTYIHTYRCMLMYAYTDPHTCTHMHAYTWFVCTYNVPHTCGHNEPGVMLHNSAIHTYIHTGPYSSATHGPMFCGSCIHECMYTWMHVYMNACTHECLCTWMHVHMNACIHATWITHICALGHTALSFDQYLIRPILKSTDHDLTSTQLCWRL
jgi:hypothetical protein